MPKAAPHAGIAPEVLDGALRARGARPTRQRRAIFMALSSRLDHPTAETLHRAVRPRVPGLSLATVYTTLEILVGAGLAGRLVGPDGVARYDARTDGHDHRRCLACGAIDDLDRPAQEDPLPLYTSAGFRPIAYRIEVTGYCAGCQTKAGAHHESGEAPPPSRSTHSRSEGENR